MPKFRNVIAGLAISTALAGGAVGLSSATSATAANAATIHTWRGWGDCDECGWRRSERDCGRWGGCHNRWRKHENFRRTAKAALVNVRNCESDGDTIVDIDGDDD